MRAVERPGALGHQVNKHLSESRRNTSEAASGSTGANLSLREAASAVARASSSSFLRAFPFDVVVYDGCPIRASCVRARLA
jgi:hypothetical protein